MRAVALIPARGGSTRLPGKNIMPLGGVPLIAHSIRGAQLAGVFDQIIVSTDDEEIAATAERFGARVPGLRPAEMATSTSPDIEWVVHVLDALAAGGEVFEVFSILRPTSPFRSPASIKEAVQLLVDAGEDADSVRAVHPVKEHPGKMWLVDGPWLRPLLPQPTTGVPLHSRQFHALPPVFVQDSSLEVAWTRVVAEGGGISGSRVLAWHSPGHEGLSIDYPEDFRFAEELVSAGEAQLPV